MKRGPEFSVYQGGSPPRRPPQPLPDNLNLRKQRSLTNLTLLSEGEQRVYSFELDDPPTPSKSSSSLSSSPAPGGSPRKEPARDGGGARCTRVRSLSLSLTKVLSQSEHSLIPVPWRCTAGGRASLGGQQQWETSRGQLGKPREEGTDEEGSSGRSDDEVASAAGTRVGGQGGRERGYWAEEEAEGGAREGTAQLDKEVILTMLGDLEQVLHTHPRWEDPETRRMRTVKNIADLRQNLEETMSSLRGTQISHSTLETTFDSTVTTEVNGRSLTSRSAPMTSWRLGQSAPSPRLQAGDAPSMPSTYTTVTPPRTGGSTGGATGRYGHSDSSRFVYSAPMRRAATSGARGAEQGEKGGGPEGMLEMDVAGYMSDGDILGKNVRTDDITSGYLTDGGLHLYSRNIGRAPDLTASLEVTQRVVKEVHGDADSWDDSSSVSSGLSDTVDNVSTDDLNTPTYPAVTSSPRKNKASQGDTLQHVEQEVSSSWAGAEDLKKVDEELDVSMEPGSKWKPSSSSSSSSPAGQCGEDHGQKTGLPMSQTGSWRRGMTAQVGITPPRTKGTSTTLKTPGKTDDAKASEKCKAPSKTSAGIQRSPSDAGKSSGDEGKKPPSGIARPPTTGSFGYKKMASPPSGALITSSGATLASGSATLGKVPKSSAIGKGTGISGGRKTSLDGSQPQDDGVLMGCGGSKVPLQYRSLPRPAKSSSGGVVGRSGHRSSSSSIDSNVNGKSAGGGGGATGAKRRDAGKVGSGRSSPIPITINQTDKEKVAVSDQDPAGLSTSPKANPTSTGQSGLRQPGSKYPDIASPTFRRLFGTKASSKASTPGTPDSGKCPSALGSPHGTLARQASLDSPSSGTGSLGSAGGQSGASSPLYGKAPDLSMDSPASSPASGLSLPSNARPWPTNLSSSSACSGSKDTLSCQSMTSLHTSSESIDLLLGHHHGPKVTRTASVKSTLSEGMPLDRNTLPKKGLRYPPSSRQTSHEEGKEWLRSHSTGGLQDTGSQSPLSPLESHAQAPANTTTPTC
ncbi:hypothetical protein J4Q44_G00140730 [Coregonus suidteri]|uniref:Neuron navigator 3 n=1 Tax=Coregonus suidteri TaxID=861788 RepID=A0AAN8LR76_9TELE